MKGMKGTQLRVFFSFPGVFFPRLGGSGIPDLYTSQCLGLCEWHGVLN